VDDATGGSNGSPFTPCGASGREGRRPSGDVAVLRTPPVDPGRLSGYRAYPVETVERVRLIKWAQGLGFSLREIGEIARIPRDHVHGRATDVRARAGSKIHEIDEKISRLRAMRRQVRHRPVPVQWQLSHRGPRLEQGESEMSDMVFACRLDVFDGNERRRYRELRTTMKAAVEETRELPDGYAVRLTSDAGLFRQVAEWITLERRCCPFLALALDWSASDAIWLRVTGGPGVRELLAARLAEAP